MIGQTFYLAGSELGWFKRLMKNGQLPESGSTAVPGAKTVDEAVKRFRDADFVYKIEVIPVPTKVPVKPKSARKQAYEAVAKMIDEKNETDRLLTRFYEEKEPVRSMLFDLADQLFGKYDWDNSRHEAAIQQLKIMKRELR